jgi:hypothetical protein
MGHSKGHRFDESRLIRCGVSLLPGGVMQPVEPDLKLDGFSLWVSIGARSVKVFRHCITATSGHGT